MMLIVITKISLSKWALHTPSFERTTADKNKSILYQTLVKNDAMLKKYYVVHRGVNDIVKINRASFIKKKYYPKT